MFHGYRLGWLLAQRRLTLGLTTTTRGILARVSGTVWKRAVVGGLTHPGGSSSSRSTICKK